MNTNQKPTNSEFLKATFGEDYQWAHVTDFTYDPNNLPMAEHLRAWKGDYFSRYHFSTQSNQYFTISTFYADEKGVARRRKALFRAAHVIVLDDVKEKLSLEAVQKLPPPTWILETSAGSEQWGYRLIEPCTDRHRVDNLLDGLVASGLAPDGKDPGMKGVTRYVRLPDGVNTKASKLVNGQPYKCRMLSWAPFNRVTLEQLAAPFAVNLDAERREQRVDGAAAVSDHPLLNIPDVIHIKEERSDGRFDITCPWVDEHTAAADDGAGVFTNADGTIGFKCHHGSCQARTARNLLGFIETVCPGFGDELKSWQVKRAFGEPAKSSLNFMQAPVQPGFGTLTDEQILQDQLSKLRQAHPGSDVQRETAANLLKFTDTMPAIEKVNWHNQIKDVMRWTIPEMKSVLTDLRKQWSYEKSRDINFFQDVVFIKDINQFYDSDKRIFYTPEAYQNSYMHLDPEVRKQALQNQEVEKADKLDYAPLQPRMFERDGITYANSWSNKTEIQGVPGDISCYLNHFDTVGWGDYRDHFLKWMAFTIRHPDQKINHMMILGSPEGVGKDWLLYPLVKAMGENHVTIDGDELISGFSEYLVGVKYINVNEAELADYKEAVQLTNKLKPLAAAPPFKLRVNIKGVSRINVTNLVSCTMTTNSRHPLKIKGASRRTFALWSDLNVRDENDDLRPEWAKFWTEAWNWMLNGGAEQVIHYLRNELDLTNFNPGMAPPVTDFLRDIREASKSPMQQTIEAFIRQHQGCFMSDLITTADMSETLRSGPLIAEQLMYADYKLFTPHKIGHVLGDISGAVPLKAKRKSVQIRMWAVRHCEKYQEMTPAQLMDEYERQMQDAKTQVKLKAV